jgi:hypothetical protein
MIDHMSVLFLLVDMRFNYFFSYIMVFSFDFLV